MTVAPVISALCRSSAGIHLPASPNTGSTVGGAGQRLERVAEREHAAGRRDPAAHLDSGDADDVGGRRQVDAVAGADRRHDDAELHGDPAAERLDPGEQVVADARDEIDEVGGELDLQRVHAHLLEQALAVVCRGLGLASARRPPPGAILAAVSAGDLRDA